MKTLILAISLIALVSSQPPSDLGERHKSHMKSMKEKMKACVLKNPNSSETLKKAFTENNETSSYRTILNTLKEKLEDSDKEILKECRKETFKLLRTEREKEFGPKHHGERLGHKNREKEHLRKLDETKPESRLKKIENRVFTCIEESADASQNLKNYVAQQKANGLREFFKVTKNLLTEEEKKVVRECRRSAVKRGFLTERKLTRKREVLKKRSRVVSPKKVKKGE